MYDDTNYVGRNTMKGNCQVDSTGVYPNEIADDAPGQPPGTKFIAPGEDISTYVANRTRYQLAHNCDILKEPLDSMIAATQVATLTVYNSDKIDIDPTGAGGGGIEITFSPPGYLYVGNATYSGAGQEEYDTLFQFLDENYNEVLVDGIEVKVVSIAGTALGSGFFGGLVQLTLNEVVPLGDYRLSYARDTTLATLPDDALIRADIRGLHEGAAESGKISYAVCDAGSTSPLRLADYFGSTALSDAIAAGEKRVFLRAGTYGPTNTLTFDGVHVVGEDRLTVLVEVDTSGVNGRIELNNGSSLEDLTLSPQGGITSTSALIVMGLNAYLRRVTAVGWDIQTSQGNAIEDVTNGGPSGVLTMSGDKFITIRNLFYDSQYVTSGPLFVISNCSDVVMENVQALSPGLGLVAQDCLDFTGVTTSKRLSLTNCYFETGEAVTLNIDSPLECVKFQNCEFCGRQQLIATNLPVEQVGVVFENCLVRNTATGWYGTPFVELRCEREPEGPSAVNSGIVLNNVYFYDKWSRGTNDAVNPPGPPGGGGTPFYVMHLDGVSGRNVVFDRDGCPYIIMDRAWVYMASCNIDGFAVHHYFGPNGAEPFMYGVMADGLVEVDLQSHITELSVQLHVYYNTGGTPVELGYNMGIISVRGGNYRQVVEAYSPDGRTVVEDVTVRLKGSTVLSSTCGIISCGRQSTVRGFSFARANDLGSDGCGAAIVFLQEKDVIFEDFNIVLENDTDRHNVCSAIRLRANWTESVRIRNGRIYIKPSAVWPLDAIWADDDTITDVLVDGVTVIWDAAIRVGTNPIFNFNQVNVSLVKVINCLIRINGLTLETGATGRYHAITFPVGAVGGGAANSAKAIGNDIIADGGFIPDIVPNSVIGYALNHMALSGTPTMTL
jgi:hypothetical protein